ncbi:TetR/AcrR family transcriptional regulator [Pseudoalteromonas sp. SMS1]|uniref:TetR/AcrR family transcriptional regulator n=1 Tax=Pseudoalteromonas sp. SMS1 TaxID=2908894 RepID=UPI001F2C195C|nr:TetR/AcrR family transcriptional regulator [Pseudoalteromonas sp. SMS1]MCF2858768.1 TetR/AcrR family transcriptional regulator [Pseudoalteromonas sp. SMS1]
MKVEQHILDIAEDLFNKNGYTSVGVDLIRDEAKVSKTTIYRHFGDKNGLVEAVLNRRHLRFQDSLECAVSEIQSREEKLISILNWHFEWFSTPHFEGCMFMNALAEFKNRDESISQIALDHKRWLLGLVCRALSNDPDNIQDKPEMIMTFIEGLIIRAKFENIINNRGLYEKALLKLLA